MNETNQLRAELERVKQQLDAANRREAKLREALEKAVGWYSRRNFLLKRLYEILPHPLAWTNEKMSIVEKVREHIQERRPSCIGRALEPEKKCACVHYDAAECARMRDHPDPDDEFKYGKCECSCHDDPEEYHNEPEDRDAALQPDAGSTGERLFSESEVRPLVDALNAFPHTKTCAIHRDLLDGGEGYCSCGKETALAHAKELGL